MQYTCNRLFALDNETISEERVKNLMNQIVKENEIFYYNYRGLVSSLQYKILKAVAKEETVEKPLSNSFIKKYNLGSPSSVKSGIENLLKKSLLSNQKNLRVTDWYFSLWLQKQL
jgi:hypothetical protein